MVLVLRTVNKCSWSERGFGFASRERSVSVRERGIVMTSPFILPSYFLTFTTYGTWLHGDTRGSVDREHNIVETPYLEPDAEHFAEKKLRMVQPAYTLDFQRRDLVLNSIIKLFQIRSWELFALHVRSNHVHLLGAAEIKPERMMHDCKSFASRALNQAKIESSERRRWTRGGSTRWIKSELAFDDVLEYVLHRQGEVMSRWPD